jgi:hypothetical protein
MRPLVAALLLLSPGLLRADPVTLVRVWPQWHDADSFKSYYEFKKGDELTGNFVVIRSQPKDRNGLYFLTRVENKAAPISDVIFTVRVIKPDSTDTLSYSFAAFIPKGGQLFEIGLTGTDWANAKAQPVAWSVELHAPDGRLIAAKSSFLWEKPSL